MSRTVQYYLSKGLEPDAAEYFARGRRQLIGAVANRDFTLMLSFDNGEKRLYNAAPLLKPGTVFAPLADWSNFRRVYVDAQHCAAWDIDPTVDSDKVWSNKVDICSDACYMDSVPIHA